MRYLFLVLLCALNLTANAQWWRLDFKKRVRLQAISSPKGLIILPRHGKPKNLQFSNALPMSAYLLLEREKTIMKAAQHHMRFHEYYLASYNFSALAELYVMENRLSEAKWYYLQSLLLSRRQGDKLHTLKNLVALGLVKADLGDITQAQQDLNEARNIALSLGRKSDVVDVDARIYYVKTNKVWLPKSELRYADAAEMPAKIK